MSLKATLAKGLQEMKIDKERWQSQIENPAESDVEYPYGLSITLCKESLKMLNLQARDFNVGDEVELECKAKVVGVRSKTGRMDSDSSVELQITHMEFEREDKSSGN